MYSITLNIALIKKRYNRKGESKILLFSSLLKL